MADLTADLRQQLAYISGNIGIVEDYIPLVSVLFPSLYLLIF